MSKIVCCFLLFLFMSGATNAYTQEYYFRHYQVENGLSNNTVFSCVQDRQGFMWLGTKGGLCRFNGYSFDIFGRDNDTSGLKDGYVRNLYISRDGDLYVGTRIGIFRYYPINEKFRLVCSTQGEVTSIQKDATGMLWFISANTLTRFDETKNEKTRFTLKKTSPTCICSTKGEIYIGTSDGLIAEYKGGNFVYFNLFKDSKQSAPKWIERLYPTTNNKIMVGLSNYGIKSFDCSTKSYQDIIIDEKSTKGIYARDFLQVSTDKVWVATESGIFVHDNIRQSNTKIVNEKGNNYSLSDNAVYTLCLDKEGGIWAGTYSGGVNYFNPKYSLFTKYFPQSTSTNGISGNVVREICPDKWGHLWIGTEDAGLNQLNLANHNITVPPSIKKGHSISYPNIHGLLTVGSKLLVGTFEHGLDVMDIPSGIVEKHFPNSNSRNRIKSQFIVTLFQSKDSTIYVGTRSGLYTFSLQTGEFNSICPPLENSFIHTLMEDVNGQLWIGTMGNGLFTYNPKNKMLSSLSKSLSALRNPGTQWITTVFQGKDSSVWIGTEGCGLIRQNPDNSLENYSINEDFPGAAIYKILEDDQQNLWITTSGGLVHFNPKTKKKLGIYTTSNGLLSNQFNYNSGYKGNDGTMYFGSVKGMISFNPQNVHSGNFIPPIYISGITTGRTKIQLSPSQKAFTFDPNVSLNSEQSTFSIEFAAVSFVSPEMIHYRYRMKGLNDKWIYTSLPKAFFTSLPKGTYEFEVEVAEDNEKWIGNTTHLNIQVLPPFWQSNLAYSVYILLALTSLFFIIRSYRKAKLEKLRRITEHENLEREKETYHNKLSFLTSIAHEIRTPLTLIKAPLEKIIKQADVLPNIRKYLFTMQRNTDRMITLSEELLDFRKTEVKAYSLTLTPSDLNILLLEVMRNFEDEAVPHNLKIETQISHKPVIVNMDKEAITKILTNIVANAVKYASQKIMVCSDAASGNAIVEIKNDGERIPKELSNKIFEPFYRIEGSKKRSGSGLGLTIARSLALLHNGNLYFNVNDTVYNSFVLTLPLIA